MENKEKDKWDKAGVILKPVGGLLAAITIALFGFLGSNYLERRQDTEMRMRLFTELISEREQAESALRKDMFKSIIDTFFNPQVKSPSTDDKLLNLELLAYNFHESLNLKPIFEQIKEEINDSERVKRQSYFYRLEKVAREVIRKQKAVLEGAGDVHDSRIDLRDFVKRKGIIWSEGFSLTVDEIERDYRVSVLAANLETNEIKIRLQVMTPNELAGGEVEAEFWVGFCDFPMIDNTRLSHDQRCAVVLNRFEPQSADITVLCFPGSHASLKEKPYYQELLENLLAYKEIEKYKGNSSREKTK